MHPRRAGQVYGNTPSRFHARLRAPILAIGLAVGQLAYPGVSYSSPATQGVWSELKSFSSTAVHMIAMPSDSGEFATQILWFRGAHKNLDYVDGGLMFFPGYDGALPNSTPLSGRLVHFAFAGKLAKINMPSPNRLSNRAGERSAYSAKTVAFLPSVSVKIQRRLMNTRSKYLLSGCAFG